MSPCSAPTLILHGGQDVMTPLANARILATRIPNAELHMFEDAGHAAPLEHPQSCRALMLEWFARHSERTLPPVTHCDEYAERSSRPFSLGAACCETLESLRLSVQVDGGARPTGILRPRRESLKDDHILTCQV